MGTIKQELVLSDIQMEGLDRMRELNEEYLATKKPSNEVRQFLSEAGSDTNLMLLYLRARKNRPEHAWETLKKKAEIRCDLYPEIFVPKPASFYEEPQNIGLWGVLKNTDRLGRRIICIQGVKWDPIELPPDDNTNAFVNLTEHLLLDDDAVDNGIILIFNADGMGINYVRYLSLKFFLRYLNCLWFACPLKVKAAYAVNVPIYLAVFYELIKPFFPKKLKERFFLSAPKKRFTVLHAGIDPSILPEYVGGTLKYDEAFDFVKF